MKTLILARHAKTNRETWTGSDFERPLTQRGEKDTPEMGKKLSAKNIKIDLLLSSPAKRAMDTAALLATEIGYNNKIHTTLDIYEAAASKMLKAINNIDNEHNTVMVVGHNPALSILAADVTSHKIGDVPTGGICVIELEIDDWKMVSRGLGKLISFEYPKNS